MYVTTHLSRVSLSLARVSLSLSRLSRLSLSRARASLSLALALSLSFSFCFASNEPIAGSILPGRTLIVQKSSEEANVLVGI